LRRLWVICGFALLLRLAFLVFYIETHQARALGTIPFLFEPGNIAASIASGRGFADPFRVATGPTAWLSPVYPLILAGFFKAFGLYTFQAFVAAALLNVVCSGLTTLFVYRIAERVAFGDRTGGSGRKPGSLPHMPVIAAWIWAVFPNAIFLAYESLWENTIAALLSVILLLLTLNLRAVKDWVVYGLAWGFALMTNASAVSLLPFLWGWAESKTPGWKKPAIAAGIVVACCAPWTIRNYETLHAFIPLRSVTGLVLWLGNNDRADAVDVSKTHPIASQAERDKYTAMGEIDYMREKQSLAIDWMLHHPVRVATLAAQRFVVVWSGGSLAPWRALVVLDGFRAFVVVAFNLLVAMGALAGVWLLWRERNPYFFPLAVFPLIYPMVYYFALAPPRYRHPIDPVLSILTAVAIVHLRK
jgi:hypothetical protein